MSTELSKNFITMFESVVHNEYQASGFDLKGAVRFKSGQAETFQFPIFGKVIAKPHNVGTKVELQNANQGNVKIVVEDYIVTSPVSFFEKNKVNYDSLKEEAKAHASAMGRRSDQFIIDALENSGTANTVASSVGGASTGLNTAKIKRAGAIFDKLSVPMTERYIAAYAAEKETLLSSAETTSVDYMNVKALINGDIDTFYGFKFIWIGDRDEGGLKVASTNRSNFAFHKSAVGYAQCIDMTTRIDWSTDYAAWIAQTMYCANSKAIDAKGIVKISTHVA